MEVWDDIAGIVSWAVLWFAVIYLGFQVIRYVVS